MTNEATLTSTAGDTRHVQELTERAAALTDIANADNAAAVAVVPVGHGIAIVDREALQDHPRRARGGARFTKLEPLARYVNDHRSDHTTAWIHHDPDKLGTDASPIGDIVAVLDDHHPHAEAGWGEHRASLPIITTPQWRHWLLFSGKLLDQEDFSEHLQQGLSDIIKPDAATILEVSESLTVTENHTLNSVKRGGGDLKVSHTKEATARAGAEQKETAIPEVFVLSIAPFAGAQPVELVARLRWKNISGSLHLGYTLNRPLEALNDAVDRLEHDVSTLLDDSLTDRIYRGTPISHVDRERSVVDVAVTTVPEA